MLPGYQSQHLAGLHGYAGIMLALTARDDTQKGQPVEISEIESLASLHQFTTVLQTYHGVVRRRAGARLATGAVPGIGGGYPITTLPCQDGYVTFSASAPHQWELLCSMIGREDLLENPKFATFAGLKSVADEIDAILLDWMKDKKRDDIVELAAGTWSVPASPVLDLQEVLADAQYAQRGLLHEFEHPDGGTVTFPTAPFRMRLLRISPGLPASGSTIKTLAFGQPLRDRVGRSPESPVHDCSTVSGCWTSPGSGRAR